ncbi:MAG: hypothetical protein H7X70_05910, partial [Candidatus Kapabacteria bacterium]|nr:hypothetical protein [Candidatus Kapabacteria bacterium]
MIRPLLAVFLSVLILTGCAPDEPTITTFVDEWRLLSAGPSGLTTITMPTGIVANPSVWTGPDGSVFPVSKIKRFREDVYALHSTLPWIIIFDATTLAPKDTIDLGVNGAAFDITFANATTAYVSFPSTNAVGIIDLTVGIVVSTIDVGTRTAGITSAGNQVCVALTSANEIAIIDTRTNLVETRLQTDPAPVFVDADGLNAVFCIVCLGSGKLDTEVQTAPTIVFVSATSRTILKKMDISGRPTNASLQLPRGLIVTASEYAFVPVQNGLVRINTRTRNKTTVIQFESY